MMRIDAGTRTELETTRRWIRALSRTEWRRYLTDESSGAGATTTDRARLAEAGVELPTAAALDDDELSITLWQVVTALAELGTYLLHTDHLSDRQLYEQLAGGLLEETTELPPVGGALDFVDLLGCWSSTDCQIYLRFYADEVFRRTWAMDFPEDPMPTAEKPPWDRDRWLPNPWTDYDGKTPQ